MTLNAEGLAFPAKATRRGPERLGWAISTIHTILANEKYMGHWVWNKTMFLKDPESGKRTPMARPKDDWVVEERPDLAMVDGALWARVLARLQAVRQAYGATNQQRRPRGQAPEVYSPHLFSGLMRCAICGARITIQSSQRKKNGTVYRYGRYRCSFHVTKGPAVCANRMSIPQQVLDAKLLAKFQAALSRDMIDYLVVATNEMLRQLHGTTPHEIQTLTQERREVERQLANLVEFVTKGDVSSPRLRDEIRAREQRLAELHQQLDDLRRVARPEPKQIDRAWIDAQAQNLSELLTRDPVGARREIQKHVEELRVAPAPDVADRAVRITGRAKLDGLLADEEAVRLQLVAGAGYAQCYTTPETHWVDLT